MIIVEIGQNHCGRMDLAKELIRQAKENGADLVKFQLYDHKKLYGDNPNVPNVELSRQQAQELFNYGIRMGIEVFFSVFDVERVKWCEEMGVKRYKIACSQWDNQKLLQAVEATSKELIVSMPCEEYEYGLLPYCQRLYCTPEYPSDYRELFSFVAFKPDEVYTWQIFDGFSDHTIGLDAAKIALSRGAQIIEKHFAIDHNTGVDASWSMTPEELKELKRWEGIVRQAI